MAPLATKMILGMKRRLARIIPRGRALWLPLDDSLVSGPKAGLQDIEAILASETSKRLDAIICYKGLASCYLANSQLPFVENLSASTTNVNHAKKVIVSSIEGAIRRGAEGVAYHLNISDISE